MTDTPTTPKAPTAPSDLARNGAGRKLWRDIAASGKYILRPDELRILHAACRCADKVVALGAKKAAIEAHPRFAELMMKGSMGQPVENPLQARVYKIDDDIRNQEVTLAGHLARLKLPDDDAGAGEQPRSVSARDAANSRWGKTG
ncbi:hypothetical protein [Mycolicibacterium mucogenicum]|uniref:Terminase n=1 Tax=Mycolicibacterium mucogenicum DSM 44124 TaxID=1226753 RepID=A0A8H2PK26_MYCMU|nr:hypothetical protein [Mycolicibacterium mucogenicum]KAB7752771.1 hypothetical protein MMUC44124_26525 [Mycolicibacterium mucogenicum DSM 44124]QPG69099.1 hypothetical protein C1S78_027550 [Mycolicibacterium mucogenicum DSM 44124]